MQDTSRRLVAVLEVGNLLGLRHAGFLSATPEKVAHSVMRDRLAPLEREGRLRVLLGKQSAAIPLTSMRHKVRRLGLGIKVPELVSDQKCVLYDLGSAELGQVMAQFAQVFVIGEEARIFEVVTPARDPIALSA